VADFTARYRSNRFSDAIGRLLRKRRFHPPIPSAWQRGTGRILWALNVEGVRTNSEKRRRNEFQESFLRRGHRAASERKRHVNWWLAVGRQLEWVGGAGEAVEVGGSQHEGSGYRIMQMSRSEIRT